MKREAVVWAIAAGGLLVGGYNLTELATKQSYTAIPLDSAYILAFSGPTTVTLPNDKLVYTVKNMQWLHTLTVEYKGQTIRLWPRQTFTTTDF